MTTENKTSNAKITEALELLNEAAREKRDELKGLLSDKYSHIKQVMTHGAERSKEVMDRAKSLAQEAIVEGEERIKEVANETNQKVHKDPWLYIAGAAAVSLLVGYVMGSKRK